MPIAVNGQVSLYYEVFGDASNPALVLINGLGSQCINYEAEWCERFAAAGFFVVRFDNRDVGLSTHLGPGADRSVADPPEAVYTLADMADDVVAVLDALGIDRAHVVGLSLGGMIAQQLAIDHADRVATLTSVMSTTGEPDVGQASPEALATLTAPSPRDRDEAIARHLQGLRTWGSPAHLDEERAAKRAGAAFDRAFDPAGQTRQFLAVAASPSRAEGLRLVKAPTLVLHGDCDTLINPSGGRRTAELIPGARFVLIEGMGHDYPPAYWDQWVSLIATHALVAPPEA